MRDKMRVRKGCKSKRKSARNAKEVMDTMIRRGHDYIELKDKVNLLDTSQVCIEVTKFDTKKYQSEECTPLLQFLDQFMRDAAIQARVFNMIPRRSLGNLANQIPLFDSVSTTDSSGNRTPDAFAYLAEQMAVVNTHLVTLEAAAILFRHWVRMWELTVHHDLSYIFSQHLNGLYSRAQLWRLIEEIDNTVDPNIDKQLIEMMFAITQPRYLYLNTIIVHVFYP